MSVLGTANGKIPVDIFRIGMLISYFPRYTMRFKVDWSSIEKPIYQSKKGRTYNDWIRTFTGYMISKVWFYWHPFDSRKKEQNKSWKRQWDSFSLPFMCNYPCKYTTLGMKIVGHRSRTTRNTWRLQWDSEKRTSRGVFFATICSHTGPFRRKWWRQKWGFSLSFSLHPPFDF